MEEGARWRGGPIGAELPWVLGVHLCWDVQAEAKCPFGRNRVHLWHTGLGRLGSTRKAEVHPTTCTQSQLGQRHPPRMPAHTSTVFNTKSLQSWEEGGNARSYR